MRGHAERMVRYRVAVLALVALVTLALGWQLPGLRIVVGRVLRPESRDRKGGALSRRDVR